MKTKITTYSDYKLVKEETWNDTKENIFQKFYSENNGLRYCNGSYLTFEDKEVSKKYDEWYRTLNKSIRFEMYYGSGIVD